MRCHSLNVSWYIIKSDFNYLDTNYYKVIYFHKRKKTLQFSENYTFILYLDIVHETYNFGESVWFHDQITKKNFWIQCFPNFHCKRSKATLNRPHLDFQVHFYIKFMIWTDQKSAWTRQFGLLPVLMGKHCGWPKIKEIKKLLQHGYCYCFFWSRLSWSSKKLKTIVQWF